MPLTAPYIETQQVVTGFLYQLHIAEESSGAGITRLDIGPYFFGGAAERVPYPEAVTNEMTPPGWQAIHWHTDEAGASWLRWEGGRLDAEDGELIFQMTSNYPPGRGDAALYVGRGRPASPSPPLTTRSTPRSSTPATTSRARWPSPRVRVAPRCCCWASPASAFWCGTG